MTVELLLNFTVMKSVRVQMLLNKTFVFELLKAIRIHFYQNYEVGLPALYDTHCVSESQTVVSVGTSDLRPGLSWLG
jgi:hypothetical protein